MAHQRQNQNMVNAVIHDKRPSALPSSGTNPKDEPSLIDFNSQLIHEDVEPEGVQENLLHQVLTVNTQTHWNTLCPEVVIPCISWIKVSLTYAEQLAQPGVEVTHEEDSAERLAKLLCTVNVSAPL
ncbi:hypothetical protein DSO57_1030061 [Entomophthora muscae]|uniref:Uncharacterized protein n=1 Tax=Entomophthora muscae TaxID=34485 RepID=A0ACC2RFN9_9FUNG|nr:hypothetical protein DSO57_1030061 [Entomophthora muscae]